MFDIGLQEMLIIGVIALLVFGPSRLPELGRMFGRAMREFRRASEEFRATVETNLHINEDPEPFMPPPAPVTGESTVTPALPSETEAALVEGAPAPGSVATEIGEPFCAQRGSRLFHRRECAWVRRIPEAERIELKQISDARDQGFKECPVCEPWEPS
jgi:TatA/E family protein of Tat protein translocase